MKESQQAHVVLSLGQRQLEIPLLEGNSLRASRIELLRAGLQVGEVSAVTMPDEPVDNVVPHLVGLNEIDTKRRLDVARLHRKVNYVTAPQWPHASVIDQSPLAGTR